MALLDGEEITLADLGIKIHERHYSTLMDAVIRIVEKGWVATVNHDLRHFAIVRHRFDKKERDAEAPRLKIKITRLGQLLLNYFEEYRKVANA